jgi:hypothetical protein
VRRSLLGHPWCAFCVLLLHEQIRTAKCHLLPCMVKIVLRIRQPKLKTLAPCSLRLSATRQQYFFSQNKPATRNQPAVLFSRNKPAPPNRTGRRLSAGSRDGRWIIKLPASPHQVDSSIVFFLLYDPGSPATFSYRHPACVLGNSTTSQDVLLRVLINLPYYDTRKSPNAPRPTPSSLVINFPTCLSQVNS